MVQLEPPPPPFAEGAPRCKFSAGKAPTTASAAKPERIAKREKCIVIELRIGKLGFCLVD